MIAAPWKPPIKDSWQLRIDHDLGAVHWLRRPFSSNGGSHAPLPSIPAHFQRVPFRPGQLRVVADEDGVTDEDLERLRGGRLFQAGFLQIPVVAGEAMSIEPS